MRNSTYKYMYIYIDMKIRKYGMIVNETIIHPSLNDLDVSNYRLLSGFQQWAKSMRIIKTDNTIFKISLQC